MIRNKSIRDNLPTYQGISSYIMLLKHVKYYLKNIEFPKKDTDEIKHDLIIIIIIIIINNGDVYEKPIKGLNHSPWVNHALFLHKGVQFFEAGGNPEP